MVQLFKTTIHHLLSGIKGDYPQSEVIVLNVFIYKSQGSISRDLNFTTPIPGDTFDVRVTYWDEGRYRSYSENLWYIEELIADKIFKPLVRRK